MDFAVQESVREAVRLTPSHFVVAEQHGTAATEEMLDAVLAHYGTATAAALAEAPAVPDMATA